MPRPPNHRNSGSGRNASELKPRRSGFSRETRRSGFSRESDSRESDSRDSNSRDSSGLKALLRGFTAHARSVAVALAGLVALGALLWGMAALLDRPIRQVLVQGPFERVSVMQIEAAVGDLRGAGFLGVQLDQVRQRVIAIDWVADAVVRRRWPAEVEIVVSEQVPAARWGETGLLNTRGELFVRDARHVPPELPRLSGPEGTEGLVARRYLDARATLAGAGMSLASLVLDERGAWRMALNNGVEVRLGREAYATRLRRFARIAAPLLTSRISRVAYVDLRYSRGFAVGWRPEETGRQDREGRVSDG